MADDENIAAGLSQIFNHRESFIVIALTGRTGSGCSKVAEILASPSFENIDFPGLATQITHETRKDRIILNWLREHWHPFQTIQVGHMILLHAMSRPLVVSSINIVTK